MVYDKYSPPVPKEIKVKFGKGVTGTLTIPQSFESDSPFEQDLVPYTHKASLILHGQGGHRDYCYQKHLAHRLTHELGIFTLRIDFRGCGDSDDNANELEGRSLDQDLEDIQDAAEFLIDGKLNGLNINLTLSSIISHSRGAVAMFLWCMKQDDLMKNGGANASKAIIVPNIINCACRYTSPTVLERYAAFENFDFVAASAFRYGKYQRLKLSTREIISLSKPDFSKLHELSTDWSVLSIYGTEDEIIPRYDPANIANALNRGYLSHTLKLIPDSNHAFFSKKEIELDDDMEDVNPYKLPIKNKRVNFNYLVSDYIMDWLSPQNELDRFLHSTNVIGRVSRWKNIQGVNNFRDIGGWRIQHPTFPSENTPGDNLIAYVKPNFAFRCANVANLTNFGAETMSKLGIKAIFDLRSDGEIEQDGYPKNLSQFGIKRIHAPVYSKDDYSPQAIAIRYTNLMTSWSTYIHVYEDMLEMGVGAYKRVFEYIRDENEPFVFHCTAGKDRTGVLGMLILLLAGVDKNTIAKEYELTTIGLKPDHPVLKSKFQQTVQKLREKLGNGDEASDIENLISQGRSNWKIEHDGFENLISSRYEAMLATIELFLSKYGSIIAYFKEKLGFSQNDILKIYQNILVLDPQNFGYEVSSQINWDHRNLKKAHL